MKQTLATSALAIMAIYVSIVFFAVMSKENKVENQPPTHYHATCTDDIFNGEVIKKGKKYYLDSGQEIWIPLKECVLVEL